MSVFTVAAPANPLNPVRTLAWNATMRAGDDVKIAFTLLDDDCETPVSVSSANALMTLYREHHGIHSWDYGWGCGDYYDGPYGRPAASLAGAIQDETAIGVGRINFFLPAAQSVGLWEGRYRAFISVDQYDGVSTEIEGLVQVRPQARNLLGNMPRQYFTIGESGIGLAAIAPQVINGLPSDDFGFPLAWQQSVAPIVTSDTSAVLGVAVLGRMVLGSSASSSSAPNGTSSVLGTAMLGQMVLGS